ncbi:hypothetical protein [Lacinutrix sp. WUR7]|uniref:hypothetical protein n=1 Tax=Lacinutrix sp. WUR7 TaxID=2653681 RepID=UPI001EF00BE2|nr:hypothetical protein [Lacinutrix sp. WUR7]
MKTQTSKQTFWLRSLLLLPLLAFLIFSFSTKKQVEKEVQTKVEFSSENSQTTTPELEVQKNPFKLSLNRKETNFNNLKDDFKTITGNKKSDLKIKTSGAIDYEIIKEIMSKTKDNLNKIILSENAYIQDNTDYSKKTLPTINGITCNGACEVNLSKKGIENLILGTTTNQNIKSFLFKIAGKPTVRITGNILNEEAKNQLNNLEIGTIVQLFNIKTETDKFPPILITLVDKNDKNYSHSPIVKKGEVSNIPPPPPPTKVPQHEKGKKLTLNEIINKTPKSVESGYEMLDNGESHYFTVNDGKKTYYNKDGYITDDKGNILPPPPPAPKVLKGEVSNIPPPPPPKSPLDHVVEMAKKDANFYFEGKKITSDKAIEIIKNDDDLSISTQTKGFKKPMVNITTHPVITDDNGKVITKVETLQDVKSNTQKDKNGYVEINGTTYFYVVKNKKITYFNRYGKKVNEKGVLLD